MNPLFVAPGDITCKPDAIDTAASTPDPLHIYEYLFRKNPALAKYLINPPLIQDVDGSVIPPAEYQSRLGDMQLRPITVEVIPLLAIRQRAYHLVINSRQFLPKPKPAMPTPTCVPSLPSCESLRKREREQRVSSDEVVAEKSPVKKRKIRFEQKGLAVTVRDV